MANPRLLASWLAGLLLAGMLAGCTLGPIWAHRVAGRIVDRETGRPIAGAEVFYGYPEYTPFGARCCRSHRWTTTDSDGHFEFEGEWAIGSPTLIGSFQSHPYLNWIHPDYGVAAFSSSEGRLDRYDPDLDWETLELDMVRDELFIRMMAEDTERYCIPGLVVDCWRSCEVWFRGEAECLKRSRGRRPE